MSFVRIRRRRQGATLDVVSSIWTPAGPRQRFVASFGTLGRRGSCPRRLLEGGVEAAVQECGDAVGAYLAFGTTDQERNIARDSANPMTRSLPQRCRGLQLNGLDAI